ncbi:hypothetical protein N7504_005869 [Penicillium tannophilum]|nr:hypothetical protein N7504_005869 [Penicillium tannophilum]
MANLPLSYLSRWEPFKFDALGLVTIFGAKEMSTSIGNLTYSWATAWVPILGSYAVANDEIAAPEPGFVLYNITDGIMATDIAAWFTRWLISFPLSYTATTIRLKINGRPQSAIDKATSITIGLTTTGVLLTLAVLTHDIWGIGNVATMAAAVLVRQQMVNQRRRFIDRAIDTVRVHLDEDVKVFLTLPNGKAVTILGPRQVVTNCLLTDAQPIDPQYYYLLRVTCWAVFGAHTVTLGMSCLFNQIVSVCVLLLGTYLTAVHVGDNREAIGTRLRLEVDLGDPSWGRSPAYARLEMTTTEENHMLHWTVEHVLVG